MRKSLLEHAQALAEAVLGLKLNGIRVHRVGQTIFIPLPRELWRTCNGCCCKYCSDTPRVSNPEAYWDTLAVSAVPLLHPTDGGARDYTWTVHAPEYHGVKPKREKD